MIDNEFICIVSENNIESDLLMTREHDKNGQPEGKGIQVKPFREEFDYTSLDSYVNPEAQVIADIVRRKKWNPTQLLYHGFYGEDKLEQVLQLGYDTDTTHFDGYVYCVEMGKTGRRSYDFVFERPIGLLTPVEYATTPRKGDSLEDIINPGVALYDRSKMEYSEQIAEFTGPPLDALVGIILIKNFS